MGVVVDAEVMSMMGLHNIVDVVGDAECGTQSGVVEPVLGGAGASATCSWCTHRANSVAGNTVAVAGVEELDWSSALVGDGAGELPTLYAVEGTLPVAVDADLGR